MVPLLDEMAAKAIVAARLDHADERYPKQRAARLQGGQAPDSPSTSLHRRGTVLRPVLSMAIRSARSQLDQS